jgi:hypothetical protein
MREKHPTQGRASANSIIPMKAGKVVDLEYPREAETIIRDAYIFRISAPEGTRLIELSVNQGPWQVCRNAAGYWWFDWAGFKAGDYKARARAHMQSGRIEMSMLRKFKVKLMN